MIEIEIDGRQVQVECKVYRAHKARGCDTFKRTPKIRYRDMLTNRRVSSTDIKTRFISDAEEDGSIRSE